MSEASKPPPADAASAVPSRFRGRGGRSGSNVTIPAAAEESEEWVISYMDMVTLLMIVFLGMVAILGIKGKLKSADESAEQPGAGQVAVSPDADGAPAQDIDRNPNAASHSTVSPDGEPAITLPLDAPIVPSSSTGPNTGGPGTTGATGTGASTTGYSGSIPSNTPIPSSNAQRLAAQLAAQGLPEDVELTVAAHDLTIEIKDRILFASGRADLGDAGEAVLARLAPTLAKLTGIITVEGHTDSVAIATSRYPSNWELSAARAAAVVRFLIDHGVAPYHLRAVGYADTQPRDIVDKAANRRVAIQISAP